MTPSDCTYIGKFLKPHGVKGDIAVKFEYFFLKHFNKKKFFFIEIFPDDELVPFFIEFAETDNNGNGKIKFDNYNSPEEIRILVNKKIFLPSDLVPHDKAINSIETLLDFAVSDKQYGALGTVAGFLETPQQKTLILKKDEKEILIPFVKAFIIKINKKGKKIYTQIPKGLL